MKTLLTLIVLSFCVLSVPATTVAQDHMEIALGSGFSSGYRAGYRAANPYGICPIPPIPPIGKNSYSHGYAYGYSRGCLDK